MIRAIGARGKVINVDDFLNKIHNYSLKKNIDVQVFNADMIYGKNHIISAVDHAYRSFLNKTNSTNSFSMEILLYASGERQLKIAIPKMGVKKNLENIAFAFVNYMDDKIIIDDSLIDLLLNDLGLIKDDSVLDGNIDVVKRFGLTESEIKTVSKEKFGDLILEKIAMVDVIK
jgi:KEOPS complex subunit Cgi121